MKRLSAAGLATIALLLSGCGSEGGNGSANVNLQAPLKQVPAPNNGDWTQVTSQTPEGGFLMGNPDAPVKLIEFASMTCPHCKAFSEAASARLRDVYVRSGQVSFEFRNFVLNPLDAAASLVTRCQGPSAFFRLTEQVFAEQETWSHNLSDEEQAQIAQSPEPEQVGGWIRAAELDTFFRQRGVTEARLNQCLANRQELQRLATMQSQAAQQYQIPGTPAFVINGRLVPDVTTWQELEPVLRERIGG
jgi:protein-disulfide isomerase